MRSELRRLRQISVVHCLSEPEIRIIYHLLPYQAVFAAYQQKALKNHNIWDYERIIVQNPPKRMRFGWIIGDFWARDEDLGELE